MSDIPVIRWGQAMERNDLGGFVSYHDYAMLYEQTETLRADMHRRIALGKQAADEIDRLRAELAESRRQYNEVYNAVVARQGKSVVAVPGVVCVGRARYSRTGGNAGLSWCVADADLGDDSYRHGQPRDGELLFVLAAAKPVASEAQRVPDALSHIATLAHLGGVATDATDVLVAIRKLSLPWYDGSGTPREIERRVTRAIIAAAKEE